MKSKSRWYKYESDLQVYMDAMEVRRVISDEEANAVTAEQILEAFENVSKSQDLSNQSTY